MNATVNQQLNVSNTWLYKPEGGDYLALDQRIEVLKALSLRLKGLGLDYKLRISRVGVRGFIMLSDGRVYSLRCSNSKVFKKLSALLDRLDAHRGGYAELSGLRRACSVAEVASTYSWE